MTDLKPQFSPGAVVDSTPIDHPPVESTALRAPVEIRESSVAGVNFAQRVIELIAVPYEEQAAIPFHGEVWSEMFLRGAFDGLEKRPGRVRANREHDDRRVIGKALRFWPSRQEGLVAEVRISQTALGDETLALADDDVLGASVGFAVRGSDQELDKRNRIRRVKKAFLDHIAFTPTPAYAGAGVLAVRDALQPATLSDMPLPDTPALDELLAWRRERRPA